MKISTQIQSKGFVLISTIIVMALLVTLAFGLMSISSVETRSTTNSYHQNNAQANARLALQQAIAELQLQAGPDQRITANASILDTIDKTVEIDGILQPFLTGVWDSETELKPISGTSYNDRAEKKFRRWMVSLAPGKDIDINTPRTAIHGVKLLGEGSLGSVPINQHVTAEILDTPGGGLAWWIGDESVKAKINPQILIQDHLTTFNAYYNRMQSAPMPNPVGTKTLSWLDLTPSDDLAAKRQTMAKFYSPNSVQFFPKGTTHNSRIFQDFTTLSRGIPANVKDGALKGDLTRLFATGQLPDEFYRGETKSYNDEDIKLGKGLYETPLETATAPDWKRLADYHQLSRLVQWDGKKPYIEYNEAQWNEFRKLECAPPLPTMIRLQTFYSITIGNSNRYALVIEPVLTLWNPYNVELRIPKSDAQVYMRNFWQSLQFIVKDGNSRINGTSFNRYLFYPAYPNTNMKFYIDDDLILKPGETKVFSDRNTQPFDWNANPTVWGHSLRSEAGWKHKGGFRGDGYGNFGTASPGRRINIEVVPMQSLHAENSAWGQKGSNLYTQMDLIHRASGLWSSKTFKSFQTFRIKGHDRPQMGKIWDTNIKRNNISSSSLSGRKVPLCVVDVRARTEEDLTRTTLPNLFTSNTHGSLLSTTDFIKPMQANTYWSTELRSISDWDTQTVEIDADNRSYFGSGYTAGTGVSFVVAKEIPLKPPLNIASYRNFDLLFNPKVYNSWGAGATDPAKHTVHPAANQIIGNSFAHPLIPRDKASDKSLDLKISNEFFDHSYHLNHALFDGWFHSGLSEQNLESTSLQSDLEQFRLGLKQMPNARILFSPNEKTETIATKLEDDKLGHLEAARHCYLDGAFNVNSTSVDAWKTILQSLRGQIIPSSKTTDGVISQTFKEDSKTPFPRFITPTGTSADTSKTQQDLWAGFRTLSDDDIDLLARNIVEQVKIRGPFHSMSDFVNRRLSTTSEDTAATANATRPYNLSLKSSLQTAIDETGINQKLYKTIQNDAAVDAVGYPNPDAAKGLRSAGASGYLSQGDILQALGTILTVRGDTFVIRTYGESRDASGKVQAKAWCEAVVQRSHNFISPANSSETKIHDLNDINKLFGRKFNIISFRWLNSKEI